MKKKPTITRTVEDILATLPSKRSNNDYKILCEDLEKKIEKNQKLMKEIKKHSSQMWELQAEVREHTINQLRKNNSPTWKFLTCKEYDEMQEEIKRTETTYFN